jgi:hypothetical protein
MNSPRIPARAVYKLTHPAIFKLHQTSCLLAAVCALEVSYAATVDVKAGLNNLVIEQVVYTVGGIPVPQFAEAAGVTNVGNSEVYLTSVKPVGGTALTFFNTGVATVLNINPQMASISGIGIFNNGVTTASNAGFPAYAAALAGTTMDTDLRNFSYHDFLSPGPTDPAVADWDLQFSKALNPTDSLVVSERWGNSSFQLLALAADGQPIASANILRLGGAGTPNVGYGAHDWNTGYASLGNVPSQAQALTLFSVGKFFEGAGQPEPVYGLRIFNYDEADIKILGISDNPFTDNPDNPIIPEPSSLLVAITGGLALTLRRKR